MTDLHLAAIAIIFLFGLFAWAFIHAASKGKS